MQVAGVTIVHRSLRWGGSTRRIQAVSRSSGARPDRNSSAFAASITASPTTRTGISVSSMRADTVAGDSAKISVPRVKIIPLIRKTRRNRAAAGVRARFIPISVVCRADICPYRSYPLHEWVSDPMVSRPTRRPRLSSPAVRSCDAYRSDDGAREWQFCTTSSPGTASGSVCWWTAPATGTCSPTTEAISTCPSRAICAGTRRGRPVGRDSAQPATCRSSSHHWNDGSTN